MTRKQRHLVVTSALETLSAWSSWRQRVFRTGWCSTSGGGWIHDMRQQRYGDVGEMEGLCTRDGSDLSFVPSCKCSGVHRLHASPPAKNRFVPISQLFFLSFWVTCSGVHCEKHNHPWMRCAFATSGSVNNVSVSNVNVLSGSRSSVRKRRVS